MGEQKPMGDDPFRALASVDVDSVLSSIAQGFYPGDNMAEPDRQEGLLRTGWDELLNEVRRLQAELLLAQPAVEAVRMLEEMLGLGWKWDGEVRLWRSQHTSVIPSQYQCSTALDGGWTDQLTVAGSAPEAIADAYAQFREHKTGEVKSDADTN